MTWVLQTKRVPKELCDKISLMLIKPRHLIKAEMLQDKRREIYKHIIPLFRFGWIDYNITNFGAYHPNYDRGKYLLHYIYKYDNGFIL